MHSNQGMNSGRGVLMGSGGNGRQSMQGMLECL